MKKLGIRFDYPDKLLDQLRYTRRCPVCNGRLLTGEDGLLECESCSWMEHQKEPVVSVWNPKLARSRIAGFLWISADVAVLAQNMRNKLWAREDLAPLLQEYEAASVTQEGVTQFAGWPLIGTIARYIGMTNERPIRGYATTKGILPDELFKFYPWIVKQIKSGQSVAADSQHVVDILTQAYRHIEYLRTTPRNAPTWQPTPDINQLDFKGLEEWVYQRNAAGIDVTPEPTWETHQHNSGNEGEVYYGDTGLHPNAMDLPQQQGVVHRWPDDWTIQHVGTENDLKQEGAMMGHCVGGYWPAVSSGESSIWSLRDPKHRPHATIEIEPKTNRVVQVQGKEDKRPKDEYVDRVAEWFDTLNRMGDRGPLVKGERIDSMWEIEDALTYLDPSNDEGYNLEDYNLANGWSVSWRDIGEEIFGYNFMDSELYAAAKFANKIDQEEDAKYALTDAAYSAIQDRARELREEWEMERNDLESEWQEIVDQYEQDLADAEENGWEPPEPPMNFESWLNEGGHTDHIYEPDFENDAEEDLDFSVDLVERTFRDYFYSRVSARYRHRTAGHADLSDPWGVGQIPSEALNFAQSWAKKHGFESSNIDEYFQSGLMYLAVKLGIEKVTENIQAVQRALQAAGLSLIRPAGQDESLLTPPTDWDHTQFRQDFGQYLTEVPEGLASQIPGWGRDNKNYVGDPKFQGWMRENSHRIAMGLAGDLPADMTINFLPYDFNGEEEPTQVYQAMINGQVVGELHITADDGKWRISNVWTEPEYQRMGIATALLQHAQSDVGEMIHHDTMHINNEGKKWRRAVRPQQQEWMQSIAMGLHGELPEDLTIEKFCHDDDKAVYHARVNGAYMGDLTIKMPVPDWAYIGDIWVAPTYQRRGVANTMLEHAERDLGFKIKHDWANQSLEGREWAQAQDPEGIKQYDEMMGVTWEKTAWNQKFIVDKGGPVRINENSADLRYLWKQIYPTAVAIVKKMQTQGQTKERILEALLHEYSAYVPDKEEFGQGATIYSFLKQITNLDWRGYSLTESPEQGRLDIDTIMYPKAWIDKQAWNQNDLDQFDETTSDDPYSAGRDNLANYLPEAARMAKLWQEKYTGDPGAHDSPYNWDSPEVQALKGKLFDLLRYYHPGQSIESLQRLTFAYIITDWTNYPIPEPDGQQVMAGLQGRNYAAVFHDDMASVSFVTDNGIGVTMTIMMPANNNLDYRGQPFNDALQLWVTTPEGVSWGVNVSMAEFHSLLAQGGRIYGHGDGGGVEFDGQHISIVGEGYGESATFTMSPVELGSYFVELGKRRDQIAEGYKGWSRDLKDQFGIDEHTAEEGWEDDDPDWHLGKTAEVAMPELGQMQDFDFDNATVLEQGWRAYILVAPIIKKVFMFEDEPGNFSPQNISWKAAHSWITDRIARGRDRGSVSPNFEKAWSGILAAFEALAPETELRYPFNLREFLGVDFVARSELFAGATEAECIMWFILEKMPEGYRNSKTAAEEWDESLPQLIWRAPVDTKTHDYDPGWDYELTEPLDPQAVQEVAKAAQMLYERTQLPFEVFAVTLGDDTVAKFCSGTGGYPTIIIDVAAHAGYEDQYYQSLAHELQHGQQEQDGLDFDEDEAENWNMG